MDPQQLREPSINDLCALSVLGNVAYAIRCARRMRARFVLKNDEPDAAKMTEMIDAAMRWVEVYVGQGTGALDVAEHLTEASSAIAAATGDDTDFAAYAVAHALRGALFAAKAGEICDQETFMEIVAASYGSSRVLLANIPPWVRLQALPTLCSDYGKLLELSIATATQRGPFVDTAEAGPLGGLWLGKTPVW